MAIKLISTKAYDMVEWDFLEAIMVKMSFSKSFVDSFSDTMRLYGVDKFCYQW